MSVLKKDEFMSLLKAKIGEDTSDEAVKFLEDMADTYNDLEKRATESGGDWENKYNALAIEKDNLDKEWRKKYTERFFQAEPSPVEGVASELAGSEGGEDKKAEEITFEDLFKEREG